MKRLTPKRLTSKALDKLIASLYTRHADRRSINMMDISKVYTAARKAYADGGDLAGVEASIIVSVKLYTTPEPGASAAPRPWFTPDPVNTPAEPSTHDIGGES